MVSWLGFCRRCGPKTSGTKTNHWNQNKPVEPKTNGTKTNLWNQKPMEPKKIRKNYGTSSIGSIGNRWNQITLV